MHLKRQMISKFWPVPRKGTKYLAVASHEKNRSMPLVVVMRDVLKLVKNKKELQQLINSKKVLINGKVAREAKYPVILFDSVSFPSVKKHYRAVLKEKKMGFKEISEKEAALRIFKIIGKKNLKGKKIQLNFSSGRNIIISGKGEKAGSNIGDFAVLDCGSNKIAKTISIQRGARIVVIKGRHTGIEGEIKSIMEGKSGQGKIVEITTSRGDDIKVEVKNLFALGGEE